MSALGRELDRHVVWIRQKSDDLMDAISQLEAASSPHGVGWSLEQAERLKSAIRDWGDNCGRSIEAAVEDVRNFESAVLQALQPEPTYD